MIPNNGYSDPTISTGTTITKVNSSTYKFFMPSRNVKVNGQAYPLSFRINVNKRGSGSVNVQSVAEYGETVTITWTAGDGYNFESITASGASLSGTGNSRTFIMPAGDITISVTFNEKYPGYTPCTITIGHHDRIGREYVGYSSATGILADQSALTPQIVSSLYVYRSNTGTNNNHFEHPMYLNGIYFDNNVDAVWAFDTLLSLSGQTLRCYVKSS